MHGMQSCGWYCAGKVGKSLDRTGAMGEWAEPLRMHMFYSPALQFCRWARTCAPVWPHGSVTGDRIMAVLRTSHCQPAAPAMLTDACVTALGAAPLLAAADEPDSKGKAPARPPPGKKKGKGRR